MDALKTWVLRSPLIQAFLLTFFAMGSQLALTTPVYTTVDDVLMTGILTGNLCSVEPSDKILFTNIIIARLLKSLYAWHSTVPWYGLYLIATHVISFLTLSWACLQLVPGWRTIGILLLYLYGMETECLRHLSFTTTSYLAAQSGILLIVVQFVKPITKASLIQLAFGVVLLLLSSLIRLQMFSLVICMAAPLAANVVAKAHGRFLVRWILPAFMILGVSVGALSSFNDSIYLADSGWKEYFQLFERIARITDFSKPNARKLNPAQADQILESVGWSFNDFAFISGWCFVDHQVYSSEKLAVVGQGWRKMQLENSRILLFIALNDIGKLACSAFCLGCLCIGLGLRYGGTGLRQRWGVWATWVFAAALLAYMSVDKKLPERIFVPIVMFTLLVTVVLPRILAMQTSDKPAYPEPHSPDVSKSWGRWFVLGVAVLCLSFAQCHAFSEARNARSINSKFWQDMETIGQRHDQLVIAWPIGFEAISPYDDLRPLSKIRLFLLGAFQRTPHAKIQIQNYDIQEPLKAVFEKKKITLIAAPIHLQRLEQFIREHYRRNVKFQRVFHGLSGLEMYQTVVVPRVSNRD
jgi:hypothetical protein